MNTIIKSSNGISLIPIESCLLTERKVFIEGEINAAKACDFEKCIMLLIKENPEKPIDVYINSPGGEIDAGMHIYDTIKAIKTEVNIHGRGTVASMAAILLASGEKGHRFLNPHAKIMIHEPLIARGVGGSATSIKRTAESILETKAMTVELLAKSTGKSKKEIESAISYDNYMNAEECIKFGIADSVETVIV
jgi:ATP-dependent Clp protease protease subunit